MRIIGKTVLVALSLLFAVMAQAQQKREFRGAWIQCVNGQFQGMGRDKMQQTLSYQLDELQKMGANAIMFQVRPECDALYVSNIEPWSRFLTGNQGQAPVPLWDPLQWMIDQCHKRGMELHAWINPYRAKTKTTTQLSPSHVVSRYPQRCFAYDGQFILNPGIAENRAYICTVVGDILRRYDVDGLHIDDYFYPYPVAGEVIPDVDLYRQNSNGIDNIGDWRRYNVNRFVQQLHDTIVAVKPWVKFGVSPFGIYRNQKNSPNGSLTNGLQNYDDLYADVLMWVNNGWVDYCVPQLYWQIGHKAADYKELIRWWNRYCGNRPLVIGEDVERTVKFADPDNANTHQLAAKMRLHSDCWNVRGTMLWYAKAAVDNIGNYATMLKNIYWRTPALQPEMSFISRREPHKVKNIKPVWTSDGYMLFWTAPKAKSWDTEALQYVVYCFEKGEKVNLDNPANILAITRDTYYKLPYNDGKNRYTYVVTPLNRIHNEGKAVKAKVKL